LITRSPLGMIYVRTGWTKKPPIAGGKGGV